MRAVQGLPNSWEPTVVTAYHPGFLWVAVWSPCSRFIAVNWEGTVEIKILDATTLAQLSIFGISSDETAWLSFSPDSCLLVHGSSKVLTIWDLQTGSLLGTIPAGSNTPPVRTTITPSMGTTVTPMRTTITPVYSIDVRMIAVVHKDSHYAATGISTYNLLSGAHMYSHKVPDGHVIAASWTHSKCLQFATLTQGSITIWETSFTSIHTLVKVKSLPVQCDVNVQNYLFLPTLLLLASAPSSDGVLVWDVQNSKLLLNSTCPGPAHDMTFSADGCFFACITGVGYVYLWKESPTGYILHQTVILLWVSGYSGLFLSPNGGSIIGFNGPKLHLWHTTDPIITSPSVSINFTGFILEFSPDRMFSAAVQRFTSTVTVYNLKSGDPQLIIETGIPVIGLKVTGSTITVVGGRKVITWNLLVGACTADAGASIDDSVQITTLDLNKLEKLEHHASISPNLNYIAIIWLDNKRSDWHLDLLSMSTGKCLTSTNVNERGEVWFTPDGFELWYNMSLLCNRTGGEMTTGWKITETEDSGSSYTKLESLQPTAQPTGGFPWQSPHGCKVTPDGWVLNPVGKHLIWLPHIWRAYRQEDYRWGGQLLGSTHPGLPEPVILELLDT